MNIASILENFPHSQNLKLISKFNFRVKFNWPNFWPCHSYRWILEKMLFVNTMVYIWNQWNGIFTFLPTCITEKLCIPCGAKVSKKILIYVTYVFPKIVHNYCYVNQLFFYRKMWQEEQFLGHVGSCIGTLLGSMQLLPVL